MFWLGLASHRDQANTSAQARPGVEDPYESAPGEQEDEEKAAVGDEINAMLVSLLPWGTSILFHIGLVVLAIFVVWTTTRIEKEEVIIPLASLSPTPGAPLTMKVTKKMVRTRKTRRTITKEVVKPPTQLSNKIKTKMSLTGAAGGSAAKVSPFDTAVQGGMKATMYGTGGNARKLAYIIDASGSLIDSLPFVLQELTRSVRDLSEKQSFTVIFFQGDRAIEVPPSGLKKAAPEVKRDVIRWIDMKHGNIIPAGQSNPVNALRMALRYKPQLIFLLSDNITGHGQYELNQKRLLAEIDKANSGNTKINTIQFLYPDPLAKIGLKPTMQMISESTGGIYKFIDGKELGIQ